MSVRRLASMGWATLALAGLAGLSGLSGCASRFAPPAPPPSPPAEAPAAVPAAVPAAPASASEPASAAKRAAGTTTLATERQWLAAWFKGTPVVIARRPNGAVIVEVPREFCFQPGQDAVRPALAAVLDKVAQSMRRTATPALQLIAAPADANGGSAALGLKRANRVYDFLRARGVAVARLAKPTSTSAGAVQLRIEAAPPA